MKKKINLIKIQDEKLNKLKNIMRTTSSVHNNIIFISPYNNINLPTTKNFERFN